MAYFAAILHMLDREKIRNIVHIIWSIWTTLINRAKFMPKVLSPMEQAAWSSTLPIHGKRQSRWQKKILMS